MKLVMPNAAKAANTRCEKEVVVISSNPCLVSPAALPPDEPLFAGTVPILENRGILRFLGCMTVRRPYGAAQVWDFSPHIGSRDFR
jgi:hypothetical protein